MAPRLHQEESKELKQAEEQYKKHFGFETPCIHQFHDDEQEMIAAIKKSIDNGVPLEWDLDTKW